MPSLYEQCKPGLAQKVAAHRSTTEINSSSQECRTSADLRPWYVSYPSILAQWTNMETLSFKSHQSWILFYNILQKLNCFCCSINLLSELQCTGAEWCLHCGITCVYALPLEEDEYSVGIGAGTCERLKMCFDSEMSEKKQSCLPSLLNSVSLKGIKCRYFWDNMQWHLQEFAGEKAPV